MNNRLLLLIPAVLLVLLGLPFLGRGGGILMGLAFGCFALAFGRGGPDAEA